MQFFTFFKITDNTIFRKLGNIAFIRNGVGYGFISTDELYHNCHLEIGIGRVRSGYGDYGGGASHAVESPLKIVIDKHYNIINVTTHSFYNSKESQEVEKVAKQIKAKLGKKFIVENELLKECIDSIFKIIPCKSHIGLDIKLDDPDHTRSMLQYETDIRKRTQYDFEDPQCLQKPISI